ncbi:DUF3048 domain-containing protein [Aquihabitans daechungensis]|uniref:DUF3048 domain-containing protein n=1 Tax=Aquihabitans daechungensis TaxID=1052257 RepID=UPI003BA28CC1
MSRIAELWSGLTPNARRGVVGGAVGVAALGLVAAVALGGGGGSDDTAAKPTTTTTAVTTTTAAPTTTTTAAPTGPVAPLTGLQVPEQDAALLFRTALAVKVDNLDAPRETAVPQTALPKADVVYEEVVEGNITRLVAVFHSKQPGIVGPVRSARTTDVELLPQLGRPLLAWSGGNAGVVNAVRSSPFIIDAGADVAPGYFRDGNRRAPHNLMVRGDELWSKAPPGTPGPQALFQYRKKGEKNPSSARKAQGVDLNWGGGAASSNVSWRWDPKTRVYKREQRGRPHLDSGGLQLTAKNIVVMVTEYVPSYADSRSPEANTVGSGELFVFTNGRVLHGRWDRPDIAKPAKLVDDQGAPVLLSPGQTWIELPKAGGTAAITR